MGHILSLSDFPDSGTRGKFSSKAEETEEAEEAEKKQDGEEAE